MPTKSTRLYTSSCNSNSCLLTPAAPSCHVVAFLARRSFSEGGCEDGRLVRRRVHSRFCFAWQLTTNRPATAGGLRINANRLCARSLPPPPQLRSSTFRAWGGFRHHPYFLGEGDETRVVLVGVQESIHQHLGHTDVVRRPSMLEHSNIFSSSLRKA